MGLEQIPCNQCRMLTSAHTSFLPSIVDGPRVCLFRLKSQEGTETLLKVAQAGVEHVFSNLPVQVQAIRNEVTLFNELIPIEQIEQMDRHAPLYVLVMDIYKPWLKRNSEAQQLKDMFNKVKFLTAHTEQVITRSQTIRNQPIFLSADLQASGALDRAERQAMIAQSKAEVKAMIAQSNAELKAMIAPAEVKVKIVRLVKTIEWVALAKLVAVATFFFSLRSNNTKLEFSTWQAKRIYGMDSFLLSAFHQTPAFFQPYFPNNRPVPANFKNFLYHYKNSKRESCFPFFTPYPHVGISNAFGKEGWRRPSLFTANAGEPEKSKRDFQ